MGRHPVESARTTLTLLRAQARFAAIHARIAGVPNGPRAAGRLGPGGRVTLQFQEQAPTIMAKKQGSSSRGSDAPDAFTERLLALWDWVTRNSQIAIGVGVVLVVAVGAGLYYYNYQQAVQMEAAAELERVQQVVGSADAEAARAELRTFIERFGDTPYGVEARLLLAEVLLGEDAANEAADVLEPAAARLSDPLSLQAAFLLGTAYEEAGRTEEAESLYLRIAESAQLSFQVRDALESAARIRSAEGDPAGAAVLYERILETFDQDDPSAEQRIYRLRLSEMRAAQQES